MRITHPVPALADFAREYLLTVWMSTKKRSGLSLVTKSEHALNQEEAAERCGLHRTYYSGVERGVRNLSLVNIEKIAKGLRISLRNLFGRV
jgi:transcriptional regulator with XRE-family HTH domain